MKPFVKFVKGDDSKPANPLAFHPDEAAEAPETSRADAHDQVALFLANSWAV